MSRYKQRFAFQLIAFAFYFFQQDSLVFAQCKTESVLSDDKYLSCTMTNGIHTGILVDPSLVRTKEECDSFCEVLSEFRSRECVQDLEKNIGAITKMITGATAQCSRDSTSASTSSYDGFIDLLADLKRTSVDPCKVDKKQVRRAALKTLDQVLGSYARTQPALESKTQGKTGGDAISDDTLMDDQKFADAVVEKWKPLLIEVQKASYALTPTNSAMTPMITLQNLRASLKTGVIPIPTLHGEDKTGKSLFSYTYLKQYFPLGIAPVDISLTPLKELAKRDEHPFVANLLSNIYQRTKHDIGHVEIILGPIFSELGMQDAKGCTRFESCFSKLETFKDANGRPINKQALFYLLHENPYLLTPDRNRSGTTLETAFENVVTGTKKDFSLDRFLGETDKERREACGALAQYGLSPTKYKTAALKKFYPGTHVELRNPLTISFSDLIFTKEVKEKNVDFLKVAQPSRIKNFHYGLSGLLSKLQLKCEAMYSVDQLIKQDPEKTLKARLQKFHDEGFPAALATELRNIGSNMARIKGALGSVPECQEMISSKPPKPQKSYDDSDDDSDNESE